jgi:septum formation protein
MKNRLILASQSPRRYDLLSQVNLDVEVIPSKANEDFIEDETPEEHVLRLAETKAVKIATLYPDRWVLGADTVVTVDHLVLGKPENREESLNMLTQLSGREHRVLTGIFVCHLEKKKQDRLAVQTAVKVKPLTPLEMGWYVQTGEPFDKAGGYAVQGIGAFMIESVHGSYTNVVGLPLCESIQLLDRLGAVRMTELGIKVLD